MTKWGFWQVMYPMGTYSKTHIMEDCEVGEATACGLIPEKMYLSNVCHVKAPDLDFPLNDYCKRCLKIAAKRER